MSALGRLDTLWFAVVVKMVCVVGGGWMTRELTVTVIYNMRQHNIGIIQDETLLHRQPRASCSDARAE